jgi:hypothetical protein
VLRVIEPNVSEHRAGAGLALLPRRATIGSGQAEPLLSDNEAVLGIREPNAVQALIRRDFWNLLSLCRAKA